MRWTGTDLGLWAAAIGLAIVMTGTALAAGARLGAALTGAAVVVTAVVVARLAFESDAAGKSRD
ncbi:MAG: hypothetical protein U0Y82_02185 [Thermoleophilia bacterium]